MKQQDPYSDWRSRLYPSPRHFSTGRGNTIPASVPTGAATPEIVMSQFAHRSQGEFYHGAGGDEVAGNFRRVPTRRETGGKKRTPEMEAKITRTLEELESELAKTRLRFREQNSYKEKDMKGSTLGPSQVPKSPIVELFGTTSIKEYRAERGRSAGPLRDRGVEPAKKSEPEISNSRDAPLSIKFAVNRTEENLVSIIRKNGLLIPPKLREEISRTFDTLSESLKSLASVHTPSAAGSGLSLGTYKRLMRPFQDEFDKLQQTLVINSRLIGIELGKIDLELDNMKSVVRLQSRQQTHARDEYTDSEDRPYGYARKTRSSSQTAQREESSDIGRRVDELQIEFKRLSEEIKKKDFNIKEWEQFTIRKDKFVQQVLENSAGRDQKREALGMVQSPSDDTRRKEELIKKLQVELDTAEYLLKRKKDEEVKQTEKERRTETNLETMCAHVEDFMKTMQKLQRGVARQDSSAIPRLKEEFEAKKKELSEVASAIKGSLRKTPGVIVSVPKAKTDQLASTVPNFRMRPESPADDRLNHSLTKYKVKQVTPTAGDRSKADAELARYMKMVADQSRELEQNQKKLGEAMELVEEQNRNMAELKNQSAMLEADCKKLAEDNTRLVRDNKGLNDEFNKLMQDNKNMYAETKRLIEMNERINEDCRNAKFLLEQKQQELEALTQAFEKLGEECVTKDEQLAVRTPQENVPKAMLESAIARVMSWSEQNAGKVNERVQEESSRLLGLQQSVEAVKEAVQNLQRTHRSELREKVADFDATLGKYKTILTKTQNEKAELVKQLSEREKKSADHQKALEKLHQQVQEKAEELDLTMQTALTLQKELEQTRTLLAVREAEYSGHCEIIRNLAERPVEERAAKPEKKEEDSHEKEKLEEKQKELEELKEQLGYKDEELGGLYKYVSQLEGKNKELEEVCKEAEKTALALGYKKALATAKSTFAEKTKKSLNAYASTVAGINNKLEAVSRKVDSLAVSLMFYADSAKQSETDLAREAKEARNRTEELGVESAELAVEVQGLKDRNTGLLKKVHGLAKIRELKRYAVGVANEIKTMRQKYAELVETTIRDIMRGLSRLQTPKEDANATADLLAKCLDLEDQCAEQKGELRRQCESMAKYEEQIAEMEKQKTFLVKQLEAARAQSQSIRKTVLNFSNSMTNKFSDTLQLVCTQHMLRLEELPRTVGRLSAGYKELLEQNRTNLVGYTSELATLQSKEKDARAATEILLAALDEHPEDSGEVSVTAVASKAAELIRSLQAEWGGMSSEISQAKSKLHRWVVQTFPSSFEVEKHCQAASQRVLTLQSLVARLQSTVAKQKTKQLSQESEGQKIRQELQAVTLERSGLQKDLASLRSDMETCEKAKEHAAVMMQKLVAERKRAKSNAEAMVRRLVELQQAQAKSKDASIKLMEERVEELHQRLDAVRKAVRSRGQKLRQVLQEKELSMAKDKGGYEQIIAQMKADCANNLKTQEDEYADKLKTLEARLAAERAISERNKEELDGLQNKEAAELRKLDELGLLISGVESELRTLLRVDGKEPVSIEELVQRVAQELHNSENSAQTMQQQLEQLRKDQGDAKLVLQNESAVLRKSLADAETQNAGLKQVINKSDQELQKLALRLAETEERNQEISQQLVTAQAELEQKTKEIENKSAGIEQLTVHSQELVQQLSKEQERVSKLTAENAKCNAEAKEIREIAEQAKGEIQELTAVLSEQAKENERLVAVQVERDKQSADNVEQLTQELKVRTEEAEKLREECSAARKSLELLQGLTADSDKARAALEQLDEENRRLKAESEQMQKKIETLENLVKTTKEEAQNQSAELEERLKLAMTAGKESKDALDHALAEAAALNEQTKTIFLEKDLGDTVDIVTGIRRLIEYYESNYAELEAELSNSHRTHEEGLTTIKTELLKILGKDVTEELLHLPLDKLLASLEAHIRGLTELANKAAEERVDISSERKNMTERLAEKERELAELQEQVKTQIKEERQRQSAQLEEMTTTANRKDLQLQQTEERLGQLENSLRKIAGLFGMAVAQEVTSEFVSRLLEFLAECKAKTDADLDALVKKFQEQIDVKDKEIEKLNAQSTDVMKSFSEKLNKLANESAALSDEMENIKDQTLGWIESMPLGDYESDIYALLKTMKYEDKEIEVIRKKRAGISGRKTMGAKRQSLNLMN